MWDPGYVLTDAADELPKQGVDMHFIGPETFHGV